MTADMLDTVRATGNTRQRVFDALQQQPGAPLTPMQIVMMTGLAIDSVRSALKWLSAEGKAEKHRRRRDFGYTLNPTATRPIDRRTKESRNGTAE
jgi:hypothetical protein